MGIGRGGRRGEGEEEEGEGRRRRGRGGGGEGKDFAQNMEFLEGGVICQIEEENADR